MFNMTKKNVLLLAIFAFAFAYRTFLLLRLTYPPGSDIGFHAGVINSITQSGNTNFLYNYYQMGGGVELEFPGYHIFASEIILLTGMPSYLAQAIIVAFFSSLAVIAVFLVTRLVWSESAALVAAFFVAISRLDIEIICWGGYPNITALLLIPITFYLFLKRDKLSSASFPVSSSLLSASVFLTHSLGAAVFLGIAVITSLAMLAFPKTFDINRKTVFYWILSVLIGAIIVSPFLATAVPPYLTQSSLFTGATAVEQALLAQRAVPLATSVLLLACIVPFFLLLKKYRGRFLSLPVFLVIVWLLIPLLMTQDYLVGLYVDSVRFLYFLIYPVIIISAVATACLWDFLSKAVTESFLSTWRTKKSNSSANKLRLKMSATKTRKSVYVALLASFLIVLFVALPMFRLPWDGVRVQDFYQVMNTPGYQAIDWVKQKTSAGSMFASDFQYGWWIAGFGQRPTITNVDLQMLSLAREVDISRNVSYILDTDYAIDNGYLQVREDGGFISRHNPLIEADINWAYAPYPFVQFNYDQIALTYLKGGASIVTNISQVPVTSMQLVGARSASPSVVVNRTNCDLSYSETLTLSEGLKFVNMTFVVESNSQMESLDTLNFKVEAKGLLRSAGNTLEVLDVGNNACAQMIFAENQPVVSLIDSRYPCIFELAYDLQDKSIFEVQILAGLYMVPTEEMTSMEQFRQPMTASVQSAQTPSASLPIATFDYKKALQDYNVSYVANRDFEINQKFADDPMFNLVFINKEVALFRVETKAP